MIVLQDLIAHKQQRSGQQPGNLPSRIPRLIQHAQQATGGGANRNPALVASRHSTSAAQVTHTKQGRNMNVATAATTAMPRANAPNGQQHKSNSQSAAALAASVDELLTGQPAAAAAGSTSMQTAATAAAPKNRTDTAALKQDFLQHLATRPVARAPTSGSSSVGELLTAASSAQAIGLQTAATQHETHVRAAAVDTNSTIVQQRVTVRHQQHVQQQSGVMLDDVIDSRAIPLRMQYSTSSNSGSRSSTSSWQTTSDSSAMQCCGTLPDQHQDAGQAVSAVADQLPYGHLGSGQTYVQQEDSESRAAVHAEQHQQPLPRRDADDWVANDTSAEEGLRRSNDKLDMLLQSTVKKSQQAVIGKENRGRQVCL